MTRTDNANPNAKRNGPFAAYQSWAIAPVDATENQMTKIKIDSPTITGTKIPDILSAYCCIGALFVCAFCTLTRKGKKIKTESRYVNKRVKGQSTKYNNNKNNRRPGVYL
jgi:hypothetical protein